MRNQVEIDTNIASQLQAEKQARRHQQGMQKENRTQRDYTTQQLQAPYQQNKHDFSGNQSRSIQDPGYYRERGSVNFQDGRPEAGSRYVQEAQHLLQNGGQGNSRRNNRTGNPTSE